MGRDPGVDAVVVIFVPPLTTGADEVARATLEAARALHGEGKPLVTVFMQARGLPEGLSAPDLRLPSFAFPESAAIALARAAGYGVWRAHPEEPSVTFDGTRRGEAAALLAAALGRADGWLPAEEVGEILACYGLPVVEHRWCPDPDAVEAAARELGGTLALKADAPGLVHKTEAGAVALGIRPEDAGAVAQGMAERLGSIGSEPRGFLVQRMAPPGHEMIVGAVHDPDFGPVLACGAGGTLVELLGDVAVRIAPLSRAEAREMLTELRTWPALNGYRALPPRDVDALVEVILRVGTLVDDLPQIQELDLNPVLDHRDGVSLVDARIRVASLP